MGTIYIADRFHKALLSAFILSTLAQLAQAGTLDIRGEIIETKASSETSIERTNWFSAKIGENSYLLRCGAEEPAISYFEFGSMGEDSYFSINYDTNFQYSTSWRMENGKMVEGKTSIKTTPLGAQVELISGTLPPQEYYSIIPVWLTYGSEAFFKAHSGNQTEPVFSIGTSFLRSSGTMDISYLVNKNPPHLLENFREMAQAADLRRLNIETTSSQFTNVTYDTLRWTTVSGLSIPETARVGLFIPLSVAGTTGTHSITYNLSVTNVAFLGESATGLTLPPTARVMDMRTNVARPNETYIYMTTNAEIRAK